MAIKANYDRAIPRIAVLGQHRDRDRDRDTTATATANTNLNLPRFETATATTTATKTATKTATPGLQTNFFAYNFYFSKDIRFSWEGVS